MSPREQSQEQVLSYLRSNEDCFTAPYGIIPGMKSIGKGKARTITFGIAGYLDAEVLILSPNKITVRGQGKLAYLFDGIFTSTDDLIRHFNIYIERKRQ